MQRVCDQDRIILKLATDFVLVNMRIASGHSDTQLLEMFGSIVPQLGYTQSPDSSAPIPEFYMLPGPDIFTRSPF